MKVSVLLGLAGLMKLILMSNHMTDIQKRCCSLGDFVKKKDLGHMHSEVDLLTCFELGLKM